MLTWVKNVHAVQYGNGYSLKGQSNEIFNHQFFSSFEPAWATEIFKV